MQLENEFYMNLLEHLDEGVYCVDKTRTIMYWNAGAEKITGFLRGDVVGKKCFDNILRHVNDQGTSLCLHDCPLQETICDGKAREAHVYLRHQQGHRLPVHVRVIPITEPDGRIKGGIEIFHVEDKAYVEPAKIKEITKLAFTDSQTGLPNHVYLKLKLESLFDESARMKSPFGQIIILISNYKDILRRHNHFLAERMAEIAAKTICAAAGNDQIIGRWDKSTFWALLPELQDGQLQEWQNRQQRLLEKSALSVGDETITLNVKIQTNQPKPDEDFLMFYNRAMKMCGHET